MKYLQIVNAALLVVGGTMSVVLAVVCFLYWFHLDSAPRLRQDLPELLTATGVCMALTATGLLALLGHRRRWNLRWALQALPVFPLSGLLLFLSSLRA